MSEYSVDLTLVQLVFEISADGQLPLLPHLYDAVRRFESCFKRVSCQQGDLSCQLCGERSERCPYRSVFGQDLSTDPDVVRRHQKPPLPFAFKIGEIINNNSSIDVCLVIAGNAIQHVATFQSAIALMVASLAANNGVDAAVSGIWCRDYQGERHRFNAASGSLVLLSGLEIVNSFSHADAVRISVTSPLRLLCGGAIAHSFDFSLLLRSQLRRCSSLFAYYGEGELELDYVCMSRAAERVTSHGNGFRFAKPPGSQRSGLAGILGAGEFTGLTNGMVPLLLLGSYLNAGKGAAYGMGVYRLEELSLQ